MLIRDRNLARASALSIAGSLLLAHAACAATEYKIQPLALPYAGVVPNGTVTSTDANGDVVGTSSQGTSQTDVWFYNHTTQSLSLISLAGVPFEDVQQHSRTSAVTAINRIGDVVGTSQLYNNYSGQAAWLYDPATTATTRLGYTDTLHSSTGPFTAQYSAISLINDHGQVAGTSARYSGTSVAGSDGWFYDPAAGSTTAIGLNGGVYSQGIYSISVLNGLGQAIGFSYQYNGQTPTYTDPWLFDAATGTTALLTIPNSVQLPAGYLTKFTPSSVDNPALNSNGDIAGFCANNNRVSSATAETTFLYNPRSGYVHAMGLTGGIYAGSTGNSYAVVDFLSNTGQVAGLSAMYSGGTITNGSDAWFFEKSTGITTPIGLTAAAYTNADGTRSNVPLAMNSSGQHVVGQNQSNGNILYWEYNNVTHQTSVLGFTTADYNDGRGKLTTSFTALNAQGKSIGFCLRYDGHTSSTATDGWLFDPTTGISAKIGLFDALHTNSSNGQRNVPAFLNDNGIVVGTAGRYNGGSTSLGTDGWYFDSATNATTTLNFSTASDGTAKLTFKYLASNGTALGTYEKYSGTTDLGQFAFLFNPLTGPTDLNLDVANLSGANWQQLFAATALLPSGQIVGTGHLAAASGTTATAFLLTPVPAGDATLDGSVDLNDLNTVLNHLGVVSTAWQDGNFDGAATVDLNDLNAVLNNLGTNATAGAVATIDGLLLPTATPAPEPACFAMLASCLCLLIQRRRR